MNKCLLSIHNILGSATHDSIIAVSKTDKVWFSWNLTSSKASSKERQLIRELHKLILSDGRKYYEDKKAGFWDSEYGCMRVEGQMYEDLLLGVDEY